MSKLSASLASLLALAGDKAAGIDAAAHDAAQALANMAKAGNETTVQQCIMSLAALKGDKAAVVRQVFAAQAARVSAARQAAKADWASNGQWAVPEALIQFDAIRAEYADALETLAKAAKDKAEAAKAAKAEKAAEAAKAAEAEKAAQAAKDAEAAILGKGFVRVELLDESRAETAKLGELLAERNKALAAALADVAMLRGQLIAANGKAAALADELERVKAAAAAQAAQTAQAAQAEKAAAAAKAAKAAKAAAKAA